MQAAADEAGVVGVASEPSNLAVGGDFAVGDAGNDKVDGGCDGAHNGPFSKISVNTEGEEHRVH